MTTRRLVIDSSDRGNFFLLVEGGRVTIGSSQNPTEAVLENLRVRRIQCELEVEGDHIAVCHDKPGEAGFRHEMYSGEVIQASNADLRLEGPASQDSSGQIGLLPSEDSTPELAPATWSPGDAAPAGVAAAPAPAAPTGPVLPKRFLVVDGADQGRSFLLTGAQTFYIGKDRRNADITLNDLYVGRIHCRVKLEGDQVTVTEEDGGKNSGGTLVNNQKITSQVLQPGDVLRVGNSHLRLEIVTDETSGGKDDEEDDDETIGVADDEEVVEGEVIEEAEEAEVVEEEAEVVEAVAVEESNADLPVNLAERIRQLRESRQRLTQMAGQAFGHFRLGRLLGQGHCGVVFQALDVKDVKSSHQVALKVLAPQFPHDDQELKHFVQVVKAMLPLRHPNLVNLYTAGKTGACTWIAREYIEGESVAEILRRVGPNKQIDWRRACRVAIHVARALDFAHKHHLRHGKITPANILVQKSDKVTRLTDLMLISALKKSQLLETVQVSRPLADLPYLAPEQTQRGAFVDELSDLYNLGAVFYALLTGRPPYVGDTAHEIIDQIQANIKPAKPRTLNYTIPPSLEKVVLKLLIKPQDDRYKTAAELLADIEPLASKEEVEV